MIGRSIGNYEIQAKLGAGGMGVVYRARDTRLDRDVAIKFLLPHLAESVNRERFLQEAKLASSLDHTNICTIHEAGESDSGELFLVMPYYQGQTVLERIGAAGALPIAEILDIAQQTCRGLAAAHSRDLVHRDIKPANLFLTRDGVVKVLDFGLARSAGDESHLTRDQLVGTAAYLAPEQIEGEPIDQRIDVWALGVVLYQMLTGKLPFRAAYEPAVLHRIVSEDPDPLLAERPECPSRLASIVEKCLEKDPDLRFIDGAELLEELESAAAGQEDPELPRERSGTVVGEAATPIVLQETTPVHAARPMLSRRSVLLAGGVLALGGAGVSWRSNWFQGGRRSRPSVAVLPLANLGPPEQEYFSDGITEDLINQLAQIQSVKVISRTSVMQFKQQATLLSEIARVLGVTTVVEGGVRRNQGRMHITVRLVDVATEQPMWSRTYDRTESESLGLQSEIAAAIAAALEAELTTTEAERLDRVKTMNSEAHDLYLKGMEAWNRRSGADVRSAIAHFKQAIEMEPDYAMAHAMLAAAYNQLVWGGFRSAADMRTLTEASVARALEADPALGLAHAVRMALSIVHDWDWTTANVEGQRAIALDPNGSGIRAGYAMIYYLPARRYDEAVKEVLTAIELDPLNPVFHVNLGSVYRADERDEEAIGHFERAIEIENTNPLANWYMGETLARQENYDAAFKFLAVARTAAPQNAYVVSAIGYALARSGRMAEARQILGELDQMESSRYVPPTSRARITAGLGEIEATLTLLERAANEREARIVHVLIQPEFRLLHGEPRFEALVDRLGLAG